ncbi:MAG: hypothetical protein HC851_09160 [Acaryochloris sp. RU_4_1]|nr:hypothetical protein [Acaryochloris sp. SU_5_25]NJM65804.1 hypothetical protein [Acaryochloris sp. RU_4_1]NJR54581.1 hypothetical protein [Acaryochloris sp. CRU_2_0]
MPKSTPSSFTDHLIVLRDHYQELLTEQQSKLQHFHAQLTHINALLSDSPFPIPALNTHPELLFNVELAPEALSNSGAKPPKARGSSKGRKSTAQAKSSRKPAKSSPSRRGPEIILPLLPRFEGMSKIESVGQILQENAGQVLHMDEIITALVGELDEADLKAERSRIKDTLYKGAIQERWVKLKDQPQRYTLDEKLVKKASASKSKQSSQKKTNSRSTFAKRKPVGKTEQQKWQPQYQSKSLTTAIGDIMQAHSGEVMTAGEVAEELYGLEYLFTEVELAAVKKQVGTVLAKGVSLGHWQRVGDQRGAYILR